MAGAIQIRCQDTFSILAFDSITGEIGGAGASCVDLFPTPYQNDFIIELFPGVGAIATQAAYLPANQTMARNMMNSGDSPAQIIAGIQANDAGSNPSVRQYGVVSTGAVYPRAAAFTGSNCMNYKNHVVGPNYTIQGNILLGQKLLDSMEVCFNREKGDLACKLMAALQGAKMVGADSRCAANGSSSLFAFLKVTAPADSFGFPLLIVSLRTHANAGIEPIDSLQILFNAAKTCTVDYTGIRNPTEKDNCRIFPNPAIDRLSIEAGNGSGTLAINDLLGNTVMLREFRSSLDLSIEELPPGVYLVCVYVGEKKHSGKLVVIR
jgi:uncharacterized Ntn-hydrolase superfamily protein